MTKMNRALFKALGASAALCTLAAAVQAADVELYGQIDTGLLYIDAEDANPTLSMNPSNDISSLWGIRGKEAFSDGSYVRFVLESGYASDTGMIANDSRSNALFSRESLIFYGTPSGDEFAFGRTAGFLGSTGSFAQWMYTGMNPLGSNSLDAALVGAFQSSPIMDNTITFKSRTFGGFNVLAQYSNNPTQGTYDEADGFSRTQHVYALAAAYKSAGFSASLVWQMIDQANQAVGAIPAKAKPTHNIFAGASKAFGDLRVLIAYQHLEDARGVLGAPNTLNAADFGFNAAGSRDGFRADSFSIGAHHSLWGGRFHGSFKMIHASWTGDAGTAKDTSGSRYVGAVRYSYPLSKRTGLYVLGTYGVGTGMFDNTSKTKSVASRATASAGISHKF